MQEFDPKKERIRSNRLAAVALGNDLIAVGDADRGRVYVYAAEQLALAVKSRLVRAQRWVGVVPRQDCVTKELKLPTTDLAEARQMFGYELPNLLPVAPDELAADMVVLGESAGNLTVLAVMVPERKLSSLLAALGRAAVDPEIIVPSDLALAGWAHVQTAEGDDPTTCAWLFPATDRVEVVTTFGPAYVGSRTLDAPDGPAGLGIAELATTVVPPVQDEANGGSPGRTDAVVLVGSEEEWSGSEIHASRGDGPPTVRLAAPGVETLVQAGIESPPLSVAQAVCAVGASVIDAHPQLSGVNLVPAETVARGQRRRRVRRTALSATLAIAAAALSWGYLAVGNFRLTREARELQAAMDPIKDVAGAVAKKREQLRVLQGQVFGRDLPLAVLGEFFRVSPQGIRLTTLTISLTGPEAEIRVRGQAASLSDAYAYQAHLESSPLLYDARIDDAQKTTRRGGTLAEFNCGCKAAMGKGISDASAR